MTFTKRMKTHSSLTRFHWNETDDVINLGDRNTYFYIAMVTINVHWRFQIKQLIHSKTRAVLILCYISWFCSYFYGRPGPIKSAITKTRKSLFLLFEFQNFTNTYLEKVTKFKFNSFSRLGAALKKPEGLTLFRLVPLQVFALLC